jgi:hypothetical protein
MTRTRHRIRAIPRRGISKALSLKQIKYADLNARQKESYNFAKVSAVLADYGYITMRLIDDWQSADFIAQHRDGPFIKVQLKSRMSFGRKYKGKDVYIAFRLRDEWYLYPHDDVLKRVLRLTTIGRTRSWNRNGRYTFPTLTVRMQQVLRGYKIGEAYGVAEQ